jgi:hypothetical protein
MADPGLEQDISTVRDKVAPYGDTKLAGLSAFEPVLSEKMNDADDEEKAERINQEDLQGHRKKVGFFVVSFASFPSYCFAHSHQSDRNVEL